ncbi:MAG: GYDIA family GHMP kinase [Bacteroidales bacterium]
MPEKTTHSRWVSNGKLMISGEYLVLSGAMALAMPVSYRQTLTVEKRPALRASLNWHTRIKGNPWLQTRFSLPGLESLTQPEKATQGIERARGEEGAQGKEGAHGEDVAQGEEGSWGEEGARGGKGLQRKHTTPQQEEISREESADFVRNVLRAAMELNPDFLAGQHHWEAVSDIGFDREWGLGSSSSLISNVAWWASIDPYALFFMISKGSGYDIACARSSRPVLYQYQGPHTPPHVETTHFNPVFGDQLVFVYSGRKQSSEKSLRTFNPGIVRQEDIRNISALSQKMAVTQSLATFMEAMEQHERITAGYLHQTPLQADFFPDFPGSVKSLGAWGGDFFMAAADSPREEIVGYFHRRGFRTVIPFTEMRYRPEKTTSQ